MTRLAGMMLVVAFAWAAPAAAATTCEPTPQGTLCTSQVDFAQFAESAFMSQLQSQWCWAASISMVFAFYQHPVDQARIVTDVYGAPENIPAMTGFTIAKELDRCWDDDAGASFQSTVTAAYDAQAGVYAITNQQIVNELDQNRPLVIGARTHAMVLTAVQYYATPSGPNIVAAGVFDPWPGIGARPLEMDELYPVHLGGSLRFLATARVTDRTEPCPARAPLDTQPGGCAASGGEPSRVLLLVIAFAALRRHARDRRRGLRS